MGGNVWILHQGGVTSRPSKPFKGLGSVTLSKMQHFSWDLLISDRNQYGTFCHAKGGAWQSVVPGYDYKGDAGEGDRCHYCVFLASDGFVATGEDPELLTGSADITNRRQKCAHE